MELLIDTNILLDLVFKRSNYEKAASLFKTIDEINANAYITASVTTDLFYVIRRQTHDVNKTYGIMRQLFKLVSILSVTNEDIIDSFQRNWRDFEDCVQYVTALNNHMSCIISSNTKDFEESELRVLTIDEFLNEINM